MRTSAIEIPDCTELTARGAAFAAAVGVGMAKIEDAESLFTVKIRYEPQMPALHRERLQNSWYGAIERAKNWIE